MHELNRRQFIHQTTIASLAGGAFFASFSDAAEVKPRKMTIDLVCGNIGVSANQREAIELAARHGFESVGADGGFLASLADDQVPELKSFMKAQGIVFGAAGLPVEFRRDDDQFRKACPDSPPACNGPGLIGLRPGSCLAMTRCLTSRIFVNMSRACAAWPKRSRSTTCAWGWNTLARKLPGPAGATPSFTPLPK